MTFLKSGTAFLVALALGIASWVAFPQASEMDLSGGRQPPQRFFVLVVSPDPKQRLSLAKFDSLPGLSGKMEYSFLLPADSGAFKVGDWIQVAYRVDRVSADRQKIEVSYADEEGVKTVSRYEAREREVTPLSYREQYWLMGIRNVAVALIVWLALWIVATLWLKRPIPP